MTSQKRKLNEMALDEHLELYCEQRAKRPTLDPACEPGFLWIKRNGSSERLCGFADIHAVKASVFGKDARLVWQAPHTVKRCLTAWFVEEETLDAPDADCYAVKLLADVHIHMDMTPASIVLTRGDHTALSASEMGLLERRLAWYREVAALDAAYQKQCEASPTPGEEVVVAKPEYPTQEIMYPFEVDDDEEEEEKKEEEDIYH
jgi:hypothetical protein